MHAYDMLVLFLHSFSSFSSVQCNAFSFVFNRIFVSSRCTDLLFWWDSVILFLSVPLCTTMMSFTQRRVEVVLIFADPINALNRMNKIEWTALRSFDWIIIIYCLFLPLSLSSLIEAAMTFDLTFTKWSKGIHFFAEKRSVSLSLGLCCDFFVIMKYIGKAFGRILIIDVNVSKNTLLKIPVEMNNIWMVFSHYEYILPNGLYQLKLQPKIELPVHTCFCCCCYFTSYFRKERHDKKQQIST